MSDSAKISNARRWWIAASLSLLGGFGVGYLYVGRPIRALIAAATPILILFILWHGLSGWLAKPWIVFVVLALGLLLVLAFLIDAALIARRSREYAIRWYNRWWVYLAVVVAGLAYASLFDVKRSVRTFVTPAASMEPTLHVGDYFIANMRAFDDHEPERGDVIVFKLPRDRSIFYLKRVVGLPGDKVQIRNGILHINGEAVPTSDAGRYSYVGDGLSQKNLEAPMKQEVLGKDRTALVLGYGAYPGRGPYDTAVFEVPTAHYFVLGDNRENSIDSREQSPRFGVGYVPRANIIGKIAWIFWSSDRSRIGRKFD
jgi:signal peptidase I